MRRTPQHAPRTSEITPLDVYLDRRQLLAGLAGGILGLAAPSALPASALRFTKNPRFSTSEAVNSFEDTTIYNNFHDFGESKEDPARLSGSFRPAPWSVTIAGEAWSMVVPWIGIPLGDLLKRFRPTSRAKYVAFKTVMRPSEMPDPVTMTRLGA